VTLPSLSGIHFGHYIVALLILISSFSMQKLAAILLHAGYSLARWHKGLNVTFKESPRNYNLEKLWIICYLRQISILNTKWLGRAVMFNTKQAGPMADEHYGSHKRKLVITQCLTKVLFYNIVCFHWQLAALCSNDAKSCYNCIMLLLAAPCLCCLGASPKVPSV